MTSENPVIVNEVKQTITAWLRESAATPVAADFPAALLTGKCLRTRLADAIIGDRASGEMRERVTHCCAAIELVHAASLCHDDVIDGASIRRGVPAFWKLHGANGAVLTGDLLFCGAVTILLKLGDAGLTGFFMSKVTEMCSAEVEQELRFRGMTLSDDQCLGVARQKTGSLFSFVAAICGSDPQERSALEEAGYCIGTAYQLLDDLNDECADELAAGKTLGTDRLRRKFTLAHRSEGSSERILELTRGLLDSARKAVAPWPRALQGVSHFADQTFPHSAAIRPDRASEAMADAPVRSKRT